MNRDIQDLMNNLHKITTPSKATSTTTAQEVFAQIRKNVVAAQGLISKGENLVVFVPLKDGRRIAATNFWYQNPNFIIVVGLDELGKKEVVFIPYTEIQFGFEMVKEKQPRKPIGFESPQSGDSE